MFVLIITILRHTFYSVEPFAPLLIRNVATKVPFFQLQRNKLLPQRTTGAERAVLMQVKCWPPLTEVSVSIDVCEPGRDANSLVGIKVGH